MRARSAAVSASLSAARCARELVLEAGELALQLLGAARLDLGELRLERGEAVVAVGPGALRLVTLGALRQLRELRLDPLDAAGEPFRGGGGLLAAQREPVAGGAGRVQPRGQLVVAVGALGQRPLGLAAARDDLLQLGLEAAALGAGGGDRLLGGGELEAARAQQPSQQLPARFGDLPLETLVQLGRFGLALERAQPRARLALDVERTVEVLLGPSRASAGRDGGACGACRARRPPRSAAAGRAPWR